MSQRLHHLPIVFLLLLYAGFMISTNHRLTILDDEGTIVSTATTPTPERLERFIHGTGQHLHPPLTDILLHEWLRLTGYSFALLRVPAILIYIAGLLFVARCAELLGNKRSSWAVLFIGTLWPFGYFYARITGWYCFSFFLIAYLTYCYLSLLKKTTGLRWVNFSVAAILLVWSNYYGIAVLFLLLIDMLLFKRDFVKSHLVQLATTATVILVSFVPLIHDLAVGEKNADAVASLTWLAATAKVGYMLFALLASIAIAPWFWQWSLPAGIAVALVYAGLAFHKSSRPFAIYFLLLILGLAATHTLDLKRLLFVSPWLILSIALCCTTGSTRWTGTSTVALVLVFTIGWISIANGRHRASNNFYEPWQAVAASTAPEARAGTAIVSDSVSYFFYLNYALGLNKTPSRSSYLGEGVYRDHALSVFKSSFPKGAQPSAFKRVITIRGIAVEPDITNMDATVQQLRRECKLTGSEQYIRDPAASYKEQFNPKAPTVNFRITIDHFACGVGG